VRDFTLVIPTYNRAPLLAALLGYLEAEKADCRNLVLDSSRPEVMAANRERAAASTLDIEFAEFEDAAPTEKRRQVAAADCPHDIYRPRARSAPSPRERSERGEGWGEGHFVAPLTRSSVTRDRAAFSPHPNSGLPEFGI
jgi:hypothetical protein